MAQRGGVGPAVYVLDSGDRAFVWALPRNSSQARQAGHERLARLIVTRTKLPLRDLSDAVDTLEHLPDDAEAAEAEPAAEHAMQLAATGELTIGWARGCWNISVGCGPLLLSIIVPAFAFVLQHVQPK